MKRTSEIFYKVGIILGYVSIAMLAIAIVLLPISYLIVEPELPISATDPSTGMTYTITAEMYLTFIISGCVLLTLGLGAVIAGIVVAKKARFSDSKSLHIASIILGAFGSTFLIPAGILGLIAASKKAKKVIEFDNSDQEIDNL